MATTKPVIKWAGGKTKILDQFQSLYEASDAERYVDLFCGSLSLPLALQPRNAVFNDINTPLITLYKTIKSDLDDLLSELDLLNTEQYNDKDVFNQLRDEYNTIKQQSCLDQKQRIRISALFIYLNKRSYNGLYRESRTGKYNVPYRHYNNSIYNKEELTNLSNYFNDNNITFCNQDYTEFDLVQFTCRDLIYIDPPYYPSKKSQFTSYWSKPFLVEEQKKLAQFCRDLDERGIKFIVSNSPCQEIQDLYDGFHQQTFYIGRQMRSGKGKSDVFEQTLEPNEILIWNF